MSFIGDVVPEKGTGNSNVVTFKALEAGEYDAVVSAIIDLEKQLDSYKAREGKEEYKYHVRVLFEIPTETRTNRDGEEVPVVLKKDFPIELRSYEKSKIATLLKAAEKSDLSEEDIKSIVKMGSDGLDRILGKAVTLSVSTYKTRHGREANDVKDITKLDARLPQPQPIREPFSFYAGKPDIEVFKNKLTKWTRKDIMNAHNAKDFPKELHKAYKETLENENAS